MARSHSKKHKATDEAPASQNHDPSEPLIFISHDHRDAELAFAFEQLIRDASAGVVKCFRSSDNSGTSGIQYGAIWYDSVMEQLDNASAVVALLTANSLDRPWILYEVGVAKGKLDTTAFGLVVGVSLDAASSGPFAQFHNSDSDEDALVKLVAQLVRPHAEPREQVVRGFVQEFRSQIDRILVKQKQAPQKSQEADSSAAKLFEEIKILLGDIPRIANSLDRMLTSGSAQVAIPKLTKADLSYQMDIQGVPTTIHFAPTWQKALERRGWPDSSAAVELLASLAEWFGNNPSSLKPGRHKGNIGEHSFVVLHQNGKIRIMNFGSRSVKRKIS